MKLSDQIKEQVVEVIARGDEFRQIGATTWLAREKKLHVLYSTGSSVNTKIYSFRVSPNALGADYVVFICGSAQIYYILSTSTIEKMFYHTDAIREFTYPEMRTIKIRPEDSLIVYTTDGKALNIRSVFRARFKMSPLVT